MTSGEFGERADETIDLGRRVVMEEPDPHHPIGFNAEGLGQRKCIEVSVPGEDPPGIQVSDDRLCRMRGMRKGDRGHALAEPLWVGNASDRYSRNRRQALQESCTGLALVALDGPEGAGQASTAVARFTQ